MPFLRISSAAMALLAVSLIPTADAQARLDTVVVTATGRARSDLRAELRLVYLFDRRHHEHLTDGISGEELPAPGRSASLALSGRF